MQHTQHITLDFLLLSPVCPSSVDGNELLEPKIYHSGFLTFSYLLHPAFWQCCLKSIYFSLSLLPSLQSKVHHLLSGLEPWPPNSSFCFRSYPAAIYPLHSYWSNLFKNLSPVSFVPLLKILRRVRLLLDSNSKSSPRLSAHGVIWLPRCLWAFSLFSVLHCFCFSSVPSSGSMYSLFPLPLTLLLVLHFLTQMSKWLFPQSPVCDPHPSSALTFSFLHTTYHCLAVQEGRAFDCDAPCCISRTECVAGTQWKLPERRKLITDSTPRLPGWQKKPTIAFPNSPFVPSPSIS